MNKNPNTRDAFFLWVRVLSSLALGLYIVYFLIRAKPKTGPDWIITLIFAFIAFVAVPLRIWATFRYRHFHQPPSQSISTIPRWRAVAWIVVGALLAGGAGWWVAKTVSPGIGWLTGILAITLPIALGFAAFTTHKPK